MLIPVEFISLIPIYNLCFFVFGVPFVLWTNNRTQSDIVCVLMGIGYMGLYGIVFSPGWDEWLFFAFGLVVGYITDYWGVNSKKWKYHPWDPNFGYSGYVGFAWGMVTMFTYSIGKGFANTRLTTLFFPAILFIIPMIVFEYRYGETRRDQYFLFARAIFTFLAFYNNLGLLFVAIFVGSYIEWVGVYWIKNWLYIDTMSFIFLSFGYSLLVITAKMIVELVANQPIDIFSLIFFIFAALFYALDIFWQQRKVINKYQLETSNKAELAAKNFEKAN